MSSSRDRLGLLLPLPALLAASPAAARADEPEAAPAQQDDAQSDAPPPAQDDRDDAPGSQPQPQPLPQPADDATHPCLTVIDFEPCLVAGPVTEPPAGPCLVPPHDPEPGCAHRRDTAALGLPLLLLGLRSRRRRDALARMADRLPADVLEELRRRHPNDE